jgi:4-amino-4-deoxy-L-arabinose transferase-like glycosyltransferase
VPLLDPDEGLHAAISSEMNARGDYIVPRFLGEPFLDKPILFFWAQAASMRLFGETEAAARLPGLVFGMLGALTTGWLAAIVLRHRAGWIAAPLYATMLVPMALAEVPVHDIALVPFTTGALLAFWRASRAASARVILGWSLVAGVSLGLVILTKGLPGVAIVGLAHAAVLLLERRWTLTIIVGGVLALIVATVVAAPWYLAMEHLNPGYLHYYFVERHVSGFATELQRHGQRPWSYYIPVVIGGGLPAALYAVLAVQRPEPDEHAIGDARRLGWTWLLTGWIFLSLAGSKLFTYALPLFPAIALLAAIPWIRYAEGRGKGLTVTVVAHAALIAALLPLVVAAGTVSGVISVGLRIVLAETVIAIGCSVAVRAWRGGSVERATSLLALSTAAVVTAVMTILLPAAATSFTARDLALALNSHPILPARLLVVRERIGSLVFYLDPRLRHGLTPDRFQTVQAREIRERVVPRDTLVAVRARDIPRLANFIDMPGIRFAQAGPYRLYIARDLGVREDPPQ